MLALTPAGRAVWSPWKPALSPGDALAGYPDQQVLRGQGEVVAAAEAHFGLNLENTLGREPSTGGEGGGGGVWRAVRPAPARAPPRGPRPALAPPPEDPAPRAEPAPAQAPPQGDPGHARAPPHSPHVLRGLSLRPLSAGGWAADGAVGGAGWGPFSPPPFGWGAKEGWVVINNRGAGARGGARAENGAGVVRGGARAGPSWVEGWRRPRLLFSRAPPPQARGLPGSGHLRPAPAAAPQPRNRGGAPLPREGRGSRPDARICLRAVAPPFSACGCAESRRARGSGEPGIGSLSLLCEKVDLQPAG